MSVFITKARAIAEGRKAVAQGLASNFRVRPWAVRNDDRSVDRGYALHLTED